MHPLLFLPIVLTMLSPLETWSESHPDFYVEDVTRIARKRFPRLRPYQKRALAAIVQEAEAHDDQIPEESMRYGLSWALIANAWVESNLRPGVSRYRGEASKGLFQINIRAWPMFRRRNLYDATTNTRTIIEMGMRHRRIRRALRNPKTTIASLTHDWCLYVERPRKRALKARKRRRMVQRWLGKRANIPLSKLQWKKPRPWYIKAWASVFSS